MFTITTFDFTGNEFSRTFEPFVQSAERFAEKFNKTRNDSAAEENRVNDNASGNVETRDVDRGANVDTVGEEDGIERFVDDDKRNDIEESAVFTALPPDTSTKNITLGKRKHNSNENALVEVEPLPCELTEKRARKVEAPASSTSVQDNEFYQMVMSKYAIKEGL
jgi:primase-polymerase (primpol)-like protein